jgi:hypothetical protein
MKIKLTFIALLTVFFVPLLFAQTDSTFRFDNIDVSLKYNQGILRKDPGTGNYTKIYEEKEIKDINLVELIKGNIFLPEVNSTIPLKNLNIIGINGRSNAGKNILWGSIIGASVGIITSAVYMAHGYDLDDNFDIYMTITLFTSACGGFLGLLLSSKEYEEVKLYDYDNSVKQKLIIESLKKSKTQEL